MAKKQYGLGHTRLTVPGRPDLTNKTAVVMVGDKTLEEALEECDGEIFDEYIDATDQQRNTALANVSNQTANSTSGKMGYKVLDPTKTFASQVTAENTIYEIRDVFDLNNGSVTIPANCTLKFEGGRIINGLINGNNTTINSNNTDNIFNVNTTLTNTYKLSGIYPEWFGAKGDNSTDDTQALRKCIYTAMTIKTNVILKRNAVYIVSDTLNLLNESNYDITDLSIIGDSNRNKWGDGTSFDGIRLNGTGFSLFENATLNRFQLINISISTPVDYNTTNELCVFNLCTLQRCSIKECTIRGLEMFLKDTTIQYCTGITNNRINCFYFSKRETVNNMGIVDSWISNNYISGTSYNNSDYDNVCFAFTYYNGSNIESNFIDYFRVIYDPGQVDYASGNITSSNNQYQVFLYFYDNINNSSGRNIALSSVGDSFNWNDGTKLGYLTNYTKNQYTDLDDNEYYIPSYIASINDGSRVSFLNVGLENNIKTDSVIFLDSPMKHQEDYFIFKCSRCKESIPSCNIFRKEGYSSTNNKPYVISNAYDKATLELDNIFIESVNTLPTITYRSAAPAGNYSKYIIGEKVSYNGTLWLLQYYKRGAVGMYRWSQTIYLRDDQQPDEYGRPGNAQINVKSIITLVEKGNTSTNEFTGVFNVDSTMIRKPIVFFNQSSSSNTNNYIDFKSSTCPIYYKGNPLRLYGQDSAIIVFVSNTKAYCIYASGYGDNLLLSGTTSDRPTTSIIGFQFFDETIGKPIWWNGTDWVDSTGTIV